MTITTVQILTTLIILIWFDFIQGHNWLIVKFGYKKWNNKSDARKKWHKVLFCYFCQSFWIGVIVAFIHYIITDNYQLSALLVGSNLIMSRLLDYLLGYQSFKS